MRNDFDKEKIDFLNKKDKSRKQSIDEDIKELIELINSSGNYYTTSSCSGRIMLMEVGKKNESKWLIKSHEPVTIDEFKKFIKEEMSDLIGLRTCSQNCAVLSSIRRTFKYEPPIIHVCCKTTKDAQRLLTCAKDSGFKKSSIINIEPRTIVEILSSERLEAPFWKVSEDYLNCLITEANRKLLIGKEKLGRLYENLKNEINKK